MNPQWILLKAKNFGCEMKKAKAKSKIVKKRSFTVQIREELFESVRDKAKAQDIRMRAIVEKAFEEFLKGE